MMNITPSTTPSFDIHQAIIINPLRPEEYSPTRSPSRSPSPASLESSFPSINTANPNEENVFDVILGADPIEIHIPSTSNAPISITLISNDAQSILMSLTPPQEDTILRVAISPSPRTSKYTFLTNILDISLFSASGRNITHFDKEVELCFSLLGNKDDDNCLAYLEEGSWSCEDICLNDEDSKSRLW